MHITYHMLAALLLSQVFPSATDAKAKGRTASGGQMKQKAGLKPQKGTGNALLTHWQKRFAIALVAVELFNTVVHPLVFAGSRLQFLPLLLTSTVCAIGMLGAWSSTAFSLCTDEFHTTIKAD